MLSLAHRIVVAVVALCQIYPAAAFFRLGPGTLVQERVDPIVSPGKTSRHAHTVAGGFNFGTEVTYDSLRASKCTSSGVQQDSSAYWTPMIYFWRNDGTFIAADGGNQRFTVYYKYDTKEDTQPFPEGFRMMAGQSMARSYNPPDGADPFYTYFECLGDGIADGDVKSNGFPKMVCPFTVRMNVHFPRCGNGDLESDDRSHVVYRQNGNCPASHPILYPEIHYELWWSNKDDPNNGINRGEAMNPEQPFVLSNGDPTGFGIHGDFFNGWETSALAGALKDCDGGGDNGSVDICPRLTKVESGSCKKEGDSPDLPEPEVILGPLPKLPGCNPITSTEAEAEAAGKTECGDGSDSSAAPVVPESPEAAGPNSTATTTAADVQETAANADPSGPGTADAPDGETSDAGMEGPTKPTPSSGDGPDQDPEIPALPTGAARARQDTDEEPDEIPSPTSPQAGLEAMASSATAAKPKKPNCGGKTTTSTVVATARRRQTQVKRHRNQREVHLE